MNLGQLFLEIIVAAFLLQTRIKMFTIKGKILQPHPIHIHATGEESDDLRDLYKIMKTQQGSDNRSLRRLPAMLETWGESNLLEVA